MDSPFYLTATVIFLLTNSIGDSCSSFDIAIVILILVLVLVLEKVSTCSPLVIGSY